MIQINPLSKLDAIVSIPASKYVANRVLVLAALADGTSHIRNVPENNDINQAIKALSQLGVQIKKQDNKLIITGTNGKLKTPDKEINVGQSGTLMRFATALASLVPGKVNITGSKRIKQRPIKPLLKSLNQLGVQTASENNGFLPISITGGSLQGGKTTIKGNISSQFISALLLIAPLARQDVEIKVTKGLVSKKYVDLTINILEKFGISVWHKNHRVFKIKCKQKIQPVRLTIPSDWSSASYFLAAAALIPGKVKIKNLNMNCVQGESKFPELLEKIGCSVNLGKDWVKVIGNNPLSGIEIDMSTMPDVVQTLAAIAVFANTKTTIKNIANLRLKECDRIKDTAAELRKLGITVKTTQDSITISPGKIKPAIVDPHNDHRLAMSLALIGLKQKVTILNPDCTNKSFPSFWTKLKQLGVKIETNRIVLIGLRGTGKTVVAKELSKRLLLTIISTDEKIKKHAKKTIPKIVKQDGWETFRNIESQVIKNLPMQSTIIDCGGGVVLREKNIENIKQNSTVIWLQASTNTMKNRIQKSKNRPSLSNSKSFIDEIQDIANQRESLYKKASDHCINTDNKTIEQVAQEIIQIITN